MRRGLVAVAMFAVVLVVHAAAPVTQVTDSSWTLHTATSLIEDGDLVLDEYAAAIERADRFGTRNVDGHFYEYFPTGSAIVTVPLLLAGRAVGVEPIIGATPDLDAQRLLGSIFVAAAAALILYGVARHTASTEAGVVAAVVFAFATSAWSTASRALWTHAPSTALVALALVLVTGRRRWPELAGAGAAVGVAYFVRPTNLLTIAALAVFVAVRCRWRAWPFAAGVVAAVVPFALFYVAQLGSPRPPYFDNERLDISGEAFEAFAGNLISPARGLLVHSPVLVFAAVGFVFRRRETFERLLAGVVVAHLVVLACFPHWWGGWQYGPRLTTDIAPHAAWLIGAAVMWLRQQERRAARLAFAVTLAWSVGLHAKGATDGDTFAWNFDPVNVDADPSRVWDWSDPPFGR